MERFSAKLELINHFDDLIQQIDIDIDECLPKYNENQIIGETKCFQVKNRRIIFKFNSKLIEFNSNTDNQQQTIDEWSESTKVTDYLKEIRMRTIEALRNEQKESVEKIPSLFDFQNSELLTKEENRSKLFAEKFYFQVRIKNPDYKSWLFDNFTLVTDFYMSQSEIDTLEELINTKEPFRLYSFEPIPFYMKLKPNPIFDEKMVLIYLLYENFCANLKNHFPNGLIHVFKQHVSNFCFFRINANIPVVNLNSSTIDLSKLESFDITNINADMDYIIIDNLPSLKFLTVRLNSLKNLLLANLNALERLQLTSKKVINLEPDLFDHIPNIKIFSYNNNSMAIQFDNFEKLIRARNISFISDLNFRFIINNLSSRIEKLHIKEFDIDDLKRVFSDHQFPTLLSLSITFCKTLKRIEKSLFADSLPMLQTLDISKNCKLEKIDFDAFSNLKQLVSLSLRINSIKKFKKKSFSGLENLKEFNFSYKKFIKLNVRFLEAFECDVCKKMFHERSCLNMHRDRHSTTDKLLNHRGRFNQIIYI